MNKTSINDFLKGVVILIAFGFGVYGLFVYRYFTVLWYASAACFFITSTYCLAKVYLANIIVLPILALGAYLLFTKLPKQPFFWPAVAIILFYMFWAIVSNHKEKTRCPFCGAAGSMYFKDKKETSRKSGRESVVRTDDVESSGKVKFGTFNEKEVNQYGTITRTEQIDVTYVTYAHRYSCSSCGKDIFKNETERFEKSSDLIRKI